MRALISNTGAIWEDALVHFKHVPYSRGKEGMPHELPARRCMQLLGQTQRCGTPGCHRRDYDLAIIWEWRVMCELSILLLDNIRSMTSIYLRASHPACLAASPT